jgi:hypothetical protein
MPHLDMLVPAFAFVCTFVPFLMLRRNEDARALLSVSGLCLAVTAAVPALLRSVNDHLVAHYAAAGDYIDLSQKVTILSEACTDHLSGLLAAAGLLAVATVWCFFGLPKSFSHARLFALLPAAAFFLPMAWLGLRGVGLRDRLLREAFSRVEVPSSHLSFDEGCGALAEAVDVAGDMDQAVRLRPDARRLAHRCVAGWLAAFDRGGEERARLEARAHMAHQLHAIEGTTVMDWIESTNLLADPEQAHEVTLRKMLAMASAR